MPERYHSVDTLESMEVPFRFAICNEIFGETPLEQICKEARQIGYDGIELAPHTLAQDATQLTPEQRDTIRSQIEDAGLEFVGLHWLLVSPPGLHVTTPDETIRIQSWDYVHRAIDLCADLVTANAQSSPVVVFGSPKQRSTTGGATIRQATDVLANGLAHAAAHAETRGVKLLLEALSPDQSDVVNCLGDAVQIVKQIGSPAVQTMFDVHNAVKEQESHPDLIRKYAGYIGHVHVNELDGTEPGFRDYDFGALLSTLYEVEYAGWVSLEAFDFSRPGSEIAARALRRLQDSLPSEAAIASGV
jgi:D-psicose/D-tagatose/L-ribulose 3-epimerase